MNAVPLSELLNTLRWGGSVAREYLADRIEEHGIEQKPYVPMTDDEMNEVIAKWYEGKTDSNTLTRHIELTAIKRAGLEAKGGDA